ncbi:uncharacterized protein AB9X84_025434 isoform 1-T2 [Acanthopagrus schlegelii]
MTTISSAVRVVGAAGLIMVASTFSMREIMRGSGLSGLIATFCRFWLLETSCMPRLLKPGSRPWLLISGGRPRIVLPQYCRVRSRRGTYVARQKWRRHWPVRCGELSPCRKWPGRCTVLPPPCLCHAIPAGIIGTSPSASVRHFSPHTFHVERISSRCISI